MFEAEDHEPQVDADLRCGKTGAIEMDHRFAHVGEQRLELRRAEGRDGLGDAQQARIAHAQHFADHGAPRFGVYLPTPSADSLTSVESRVIPASAMRSR